MTLAAVAYHETHPGYKHRKIFLLGSVVAAIVIGVFERSSVDTMILTNLPWCLVLSTITQTVVYSISRTSSHERLLDQPASGKDWI
jgi:hypothetical protein